MRLFLDYDREELDGQYFVRGHVPDWDERISEFARLSSVRHAEAPSHLNIPYGDQPRQQLDVMIPSEGSKNASVLVFLHGGYWRMMDKSQFGYVARTSDAAGALCVVPNYRLLPEVGLEEIVQDACDAVRWVLQYIAHYGGAAARVVLCGHSAGAQLAAQVATHVGRQFQGYVGISGVYDLRLVQQCFLNDIGFLNNATERRFNSAEAVSALPCPANFVYGDREPPEFGRQSREQAMFWNRPGSPTSLTCLPKLNHATIVAQLNDPNSNVSTIVQSHLNR